MMSEAYRKNLKQKFPKGSSPEGREKKRLKMQMNLLTREQSLPNVLTKRLKFNNYFYLYNKIYLKSLFKIYLKNLFKIQKFFFMYEVIFLTQELISNILNLANLLKFDQFLYVPVFLVILTIAYRL